MDEQMPAAGILASVRGIYEDRVYWTTCGIRLPYKVNLSAALASPPALRLIVDDFIRAIPPHANAVSAVGGALPFASVVAAELGIACIALKEEDTKVVLGTAEYRARRVLSEDELQTGLRPPPMKITLEGELDRASRIVLLGDVVVTGRTTNAAIQAIELESAVNDLGCTVLGAICYLQRSKVRFEPPTVPFSRVYWDYHIFE